MTKREVVISLLSSGLALVIYSSLDINSAPNIKTNDKLIKRMLGYRELAASVCFSNDVPARANDHFCGAFNALDYVLKEETGQWEPKKKDRK